MFVVILLISFLLVYVVMVDIVSYPSPVNMFIVGLSVSLYVVMVDIMSYPSLVNMFIVGLSVSSLYVVKVDIMTYPSLVNMFIVGLSVCFISLCVVRVAITYQQLPQQWLCAHRYCSVTHAHTYMSGRQALSGICLLCIFTVLMLASVCLFNC